MLGINKLLAFLRRQMGLRTDAASATGSAHAKLTFINNVLAGKANDITATTLTMYFAESASTGLSTVLDTTGRGHCFVSFTGNQSGYVVITVDGVAVLPGNLLFSANGSVSVYVPFKQSILIRHRLSADTNTIRAVASIMKE